MAEDLIQERSQGENLDEEKEILELRRAISDELPMHNGMPIPPHMKIPGQDGYRTPTVEDYELHLRKRSHNPRHISLDDEGEAGHASQPRPGLSPVLILEKLNWKGRIRHFTWSWFTLTMSTGGIANVLFNGNSMFWGNRNSD